MIHIYFVKYEWVKDKEFSFEQIEFVIYNKKFYSNLIGDMEKDNEYDKEFIEICQKYITYCINKFMQEYKKSNYIGWNFSGGVIQYLGLFKQGKALGYKYPSLFNGDLPSNKIEFKSDKAKDIKYFDLLEMICRNGSLLGIFAYTIHALYYYYGGGKKGESYRNIVFSICIHGKEMQKVCEIANLFSNLFEYNKGNLKKIKSGSFISCSSIERPHAMYFRIESMPILIKHKNDRITKNTSIVRTFQRGRMLGKIGFFPVYLSQYPMNADEILDFCVDDIFIENNLIVVKEQINCILALFISFLEELQWSQDGNGCYEYNMNILYPLTIADLCTYQHYDLDNIEEMSKVLLYIACKGFSIFLEHELGCSDLAGILENRSKAYFLENKPISAEEPYTDGMKSFLLYINNILAREEQERPFLCVTSKEKRGGEKCIYIDYKKGYKSYKVDCGQKQIVCLEYNVLLKHLKQNKLLKMRTSQAQYLMQRTIEYKGKKQKQLLLVIFYDVFEQLLDDA